MSIVNESINVLKISYKHRDEKIKNKDKVTNKILVKEIFANNFV